MQNAIDTIKFGKLSIRKASKTFSIPASSISDWMYGRTKKKRHGFDPYLTKVEESELKTWCFTMQERAFSVTLPILKNTVRDIVKRYPRQHPFKNDCLGQRWWECFKSRHPDVVLTTHLDLHEHIKFFLNSEWKRQNNMAALKIPKKVLLDLKIQVIDVPQQPENNGTDCGIYLLKSLDIFLDTVAEGYSLGQSDADILKKVNWELCNVTFQDTEANAKRMSIKQTLMMLQGGSIFSSIVEDRCNGLEGGVGALSSILKVPSFPKSLRK